MIWVTWRQHRVQAIAMIALLAVIAVYTVALGIWMRSTFDGDGLGTCLARSNGADCAGTISSFFAKFNGGVAMPLNLLLFVIPGFLGATVGAPLLGQELERGTWQLAWSQTLPRGRWLAAKLVLVTVALIAFGAAITALLTWSRAPLDRVSIRLQIAPFSFEGIALPCSLLCAFGLAVLAGLLLRNTIGAMVAGYIAWEIPFAVGTLLTGPLNILSATTRIPCAGTACTNEHTNSTPPVTGQFGDLVLGITRSGNQLIVHYLPRAGSGRCSSSWAACTWRSGSARSARRCGCCAGRPPKR